MSDLAPFVAAALHDKALGDLVEECRLLQKLLSKSWKIEVKGTGIDAPVYATGQLTEGGPAYTPKLFQVSLNSKGVDRCSLRDLREAQIRVGGVYVSSFNDARDALQGPIYHAYNQKEHSGAISFYFTSTLWLHVKIGRFADVEDYYSTICHLNPLTADEILEDLYHRIDVRFSDVSFVARRLQGAIENTGKFAVNDDGAVEKIEAEVGL